MTNTLGENGQSKPRDPALHDALMSLKAKMDRARAASNDDKTVTAESDGNVLHLPLPETVTIRVEEPQNLRRLILLEARNAQRKALGEMPSSQSSSETSDELENLTIKRENLSAVRLAIVAFLVRRRFRQLEVVEEKGVLVVRKEEGDDDDNKTWTDRSEWDAMKA